MFRWTLSLLLIFLFVATAPAAETWIVPAEATVTETDTPDVAARPRILARRGTITVDIDGREITLDRRQQRELGLNRASVLRVLREMKRDGFQGDATETAYAVQDRLYDKNPEAWEAAGQQNGVPTAGSGENVGVDWDGLLAFLEALIPIIEKLLDIFSNFSFAHVDPGPIWLPADCDSLTLAA